MEFRVLGPLEVFADGQRLPLGGRKQRAVLAVLLLNANQVVLRERLIDDVWGEEPPGEVGASIRVYVARLRKLLAAGNGSRPTLETRPNGYVLRIDPETLDLNQFRRLVASGQEALAAGRPSQAAEELMTALGLWRGPALGDLAEEAWARRESSLLDDLRLGALEDRVDADLALGRHADLIPELERLVHEHPHRERFVAQLMLALYRSGRQPDALKAYATAGSALRDDFGLEPTRTLRELERQILVQDPSLDAPPVAAAGQSPSRRRRGPIILAGAAAAAFGLVLVATLFSRDPGVTGPAPQPIVLEGNSLVAIDPATNAVLGEVPIGGRPSGVALVAGDVWVGNRDDETVLRIDPRTRRVVRRIGLGAEPSQLAVGAGSIWVFSRPANVVLQVDLATSDVVARIDLEPPDTPCCRYEIAFFRGALWIAALYPTDSITRLDPTTHVRMKWRVPWVHSLASEGRALWGIVGVSSDQIRRLDRPAAPVRIDRLGATAGLVGLSAGAGALWTASTDGTLAKIDPDLGRVTVTTPLGRRVMGIAATERAIWVVTTDGSVLRVDPATGRLVRSIPLGIVAPSIWGAIAADDNTVWIATERTLAR